MRLAAHPCLRRVDAEFAADGDFARGVVEQIGGAFREDRVALWVGIGAETEEDFSGAVHVHVIVHFGLGKAERVDRITIHWPRGEEESFGPFEVNRLYELRQGTGQRTPGSGS